MNRIIITVLLSACLLNPASLYSRGGAVAGGLLGGLALGAIIGSSHNRDPQIIYVQQAPAPVEVDDEVDMNEVEPYDEGPVTGVDYE